MLSTENKTVSLNRTESYRSVKANGIAADLANGDRNKDIAKKWGVSTAYVSTVALEKGLRGFSATKTDIHQEGEHSFCRLNGAMVTFDNEDAELVRNRRWGVNEYGYVYAGSHLLHRQILDAKSSQIVDHIDGNKLNNRRQNLRIVTAQESVSNRSAFAGQTIFKGVSSVANRWIVKIQKGGRRYTVGRFDNPINAAHAYDAAARELFGIFARVNFPEAGEQSAIRDVHEKNLQSAVYHKNGDLA